MDSGVKSPLESGDKAAVEVWETKSKFLQKQNVKSL